MSSLRRLHLLKQVSHSSGTLVRGGLPSLVPGAVSHFTFGKQWLGIIMVWMLIHEYLSNYDVAAKYQSDVRAPAEHVYRAVRGMDLSGSFIVRSLFRMRELPAIFHRSEAKRGLGLTLDDLLRSGFILLAENPPHEILLGVVGRFWISSGGIQKLDANGFRDFEEKGYAKAVWNFSLSESMEGTCHLATETRVHCLDDESRRRFRLYWTVVGPFSGVIRKEVLRIVRRQAEASWLTCQASQKNQPPKEIIDAG